MSQRDSQPVVDDSAGHDDTKRQSSISSNSDRQPVSHPLERHRLAPAVHQAAADITARKQDTEGEKFEDAVDNTSVRSLTKRSVSTSKPNLTADDESIDDRSNYDKPDEDDVDSSPENNTIESRQKSPVSHRLSVASNLDDVNLGDDIPTQQQPTDSIPTSSSPSQAPQGDVKAPEPKSPSEQEPSGRAISLSSITSALPAMPWSPSAESPSKSPPSTIASLATPVQASSAQFPPPARKLTSPFSWLSRSSSKDKENTLPPAQVSPRRNTASSVATITSNPEMMLSKLEEEKEGDMTSGTTRNSLKDRFKMLRLREEAGVIVPIGDEEILAPAARDRSGSTTTERLRPVDDTASEQPPTSPLPGTDTNLAPGTVSGVNAGPSAMEEDAVDWDLWQSVVYEGPAAVARTSAEELNRAIATGIPSAIRGVIWQVLAQSKNEDLEAVYKDLAARGPEQAKDRNSNSTTTSSLSNGNLSVHSGEAATSSASSVHSDLSGDKAADYAPKSPLLAAERTKKAKEDAAALQKLEKTIRRDLGARTSYSKYAASAGLQEGLFGVCKAYALFDEGVGYAQGMNFLIMPLLFNVSSVACFRKLL